MQIPQPRYEIFIRDNNFNVAGVVNHYSRLEFRQVYNSVGAWMLEMQDVNNPGAQLLKKIFRDVDGAYGGIIVTRNGKIVFSGITRGFEQTGEYNGPTDQETITFFGADDNAIISMRVIMPPLYTSSAALNAPRRFIPPANQNWDVWRYPEREDQNQRRLSDVIYTTLADNISFRAPHLPGDPQNWSDRNIRELYIKPPSSFGPFSIIRGRYQNLLDKIQELSFYPGDTDFNNKNPNYRGLQFRTMQLESPVWAYTSPEDKINQQVPKNLVPPAVPNPPANSQIKKVQFEMFPPRNRTRQVVFSRGRKNLGSFKYKMYGPKSTYVVLGGQNNESTLPNLGRVPNPITLPDTNPRTRWFAHLGANLRTGKNNLNLITKYGVWETFLDRRDIQYGDHVYGQSGSAPITNPYPLFETKIPNPTNPTQVSFNLAVDNYQAMLKEFIQAMQTEIIQNRDLLEIEVEVINIPPTQWPDDYQLGDLVTVIIPGEESKPIEAKVKEVTVTLTKEDGEDVKSVIGIETQPHGRDLFSEVITVNKKANFLEELR